MGGWVGSFLYMILKPNSDSLCTPWRMRKSLVVLPSRLLLLNFRALGSPEESVYIQHWVKKRQKEIA